jgi:hypothetical protein
MLRFLMSAVAGAVALSALPLPALAQSPYQWPIAGRPPITTHFGAHDRTHTDHPHKGIDLAAPAGTPVLAARAGKVLYSGPARGYRHWVVLQHNNGQVSIYGHVSGSRLPAVGTMVKAGTQIATIGHKQGRSTGDHLHFEVRSGGVTGKPINPEQLLPRRQQTAAVSSPITRLRGVVPDSRRQTVPPPPPPSSGALRVYRPSSTPSSSTRQSTMTPRTNVPNSRTLTSLANPARRDTTTMPRLNTTPGYSNAPRAFAPSTSQHQPRISTPPSAPRTWTPPPTSTHSRPVTPTYTPPRSYTPPRTYTPPAYTPPLPPRPIR